MLVLGEVNSVAGLSAAVDFASLRDGNHDLALFDVGTLDNPQHELTIANAVDLELVRPHFYYHALGQLNLVDNLDEGPSGAPDVPYVVLPVDVLDLGMIARNAFLEDEDFIGAVPAYFGPFFLEVVEGTGAVGLLDGELIEGPAETGGALSFFHLFEDRLNFHLGFVARGLAEELLGLVILNRHGLEEALVSESAFGCVRAFVQMG